MQRNELITIIIPVYNGQSHIRRCLKSVMAQTYKPFEVVLVDDGSTDATGEIVESFSKAFGAIKVFHTEHKGVSYARNYGISMAEGKYISFVDADDEIDPGFLTHMYNVIKESGAEIAVCGLHHVNSAKACASVVGNAQLKPENKTKIFVTDGKGFLRRMEEPLRYEITTVCWNKLYDKKVFENKNYPEGRIYEDSAMMHELLYPIKRLAETEAKLYFYHTETVGITRSAYKRSKLDEVLYARKRMIFFYRKSELELYVLARKQYGISLLKHYYLLCRYRVGNAELLAGFRKQQKKYLKGFAWKKNLPFRVRCLFDLGVYAPFLCGAVIVVWDCWLERNYRIRRSE